MRSGSQRAGWHIAADLVMIAMLWTWGVGLSTAGLILLFTAGTLWFAWLVLSPNPVGLPAHVPHAWAHALTMVAMVVMAGVMAAYQTLSVASSGGPSIAGMPGMGRMADMPEMMGAAGAAGAAAPATGWLFVVCLAAAVAMVVSSVGSWRPLSAPARPGPALAGRHRRSIWAIGTRRRRRPPRHRPCVGRLRSSVPSARC